MNLGVTVILEHLLLHHNINLVLLVNMIMKHLELELEINLNNLIGVGVYKVIKILVASSIKIIQILLEILDLKIKDKISFISQDKPMDSNLLVLVEMHLTLNELYFKFKFLTKY